MITTKTKRKVIVTIVEVQTVERFRAFEIRLPSNTVKITGVMVTASEKQPMVP